MHQMGQILPDSARSLQGENKYVIETGKNLSYDELKTTLYNYMKNTLNDFKNQGVVPDMVQVGNETSSGILLG